MTPLPDFDTLKWMAEHSPSELNQLQETLNNEAIALSGENKAQLLCIKYNLEQQLALCTNPYQRCVVAISLMRDKLSTLAYAANDPYDFRNQHAQVIPLFKKRL